MIASKVDSKTGSYTGVNCYGKEKVERLNKEIAQYEMEEFYSDSLSDEPLAKLAKKAFIVNKNEIITWEEYQLPIKTKLKKMFLSRSFISFAIIGIIDTIVSISLSWLIALKMNANISFMIGYIASISLGYLLNTFFVYHERLDIHKYVKFCMSYIPNFIIQNMIVVLTYNILDLPNVVAYLIAAFIGFPLTYIFVKLFAFGETNTEKSKKFNSYLSSTVIYLILFCTIGFSLPLLLNIIHLTMNKFTILYVMILTIAFYIFWEKKIKREQVAIKHILKTILLSTIILLLTILLSTFIIDTTSMENKNYSKTAITYLKEGWNPIYEDAKNFTIEENADLLVKEPDALEGMNQQCKGNWSFSAMLYAITNKIEAGKCINLIILYILFVEVYLLFNEKYGKLVAGTLGLAICMTPIVCLQVFSYDTAGVLSICFYLILITLIALTAKKNVDRVREKLILFCTIIMMLNIDFSGLLYAGVPCLIFSIYWLVKNRKQENWKKASISMITYFITVFVIAVCVVGFSPYMKNGINYSKDSTTNYDNSKLESYILSIHAEKEEEIILNKVLQSKVCYGSILLLSIGILVWYLILNRKRKNKEKDILFLLLVCIASMSIFISNYLQLAPPIYLLVIIGLGILLTNSDFKNKRYKRIFNFIFIVIMLLNISVYAKAVTYQAELSREFYEQLVKVKNEEEINKMK